MELLRPRPPATVSWVSVAPHLQLHLQIRRKEARRKLCGGQAIRKKEFRDAPQKHTKAPGDQRGHKGKTKLGKLSRTMAPARTPVWHVGDPDCHLGPHPQQHLIVQERYLPPTRVLPSHPPWTMARSLTREPMSQMSGPQLDACVLPRSCLSSLRAKAVILLLQVAVVSECSGL